MAYFVIAVRNKNYSSLFNQLLYHKQIMSDINIKPLADRVVVLPAEAETKTSGGIYIPDNSAEKPQRGTVVAVGSGTADHTMSVKVGDHVLYEKYGNTEFKVDATEYLIMKESSIIGILEG